ncbi:MAG: hypothetical protein LBS74_08715 [Oscillospiraceae bacterium]|nr:hypothetical protein [Oscillospiraceae bacterium]
MKAIKFFKVVSIITFLCAFAMLSATLPNMLEPHLTFYGRMMQSAGKLKDESSLNEYINRSNSYDKNHTGRKPEITFHTRVKNGLFGYKLIVDVEVKGQQGLLSPKGYVVPIINGVYPLLEDRKDLRDFGRAQITTIGYRSGRVGENTVRILYRPNSSDIFYDEIVGGAYRSYAREDGKRIDDTYITTYSAEQTYYSLPLIYPIVALAIISLITALIARKLKKRKKLREEYPDKILSYSSKES